MSSKRLVVAIKKHTSSTNTMMYALPPVLTINGVEVLIHYNPLFVRDPFSTKVATNFDLLIDNDYTMSLSPLGGIEHLCDKPIVKLMRYSKDEIMYQAAKAGLKHKIEVVTPYDVVYKGSKTYDQPFLMNTPNDVTHVIYKDIYGSNGDAQFIVPIDKVFVFTRDLIKSTFGELKARYPVVKFYGDVDDNEQATESFSYAIFPYLPNVTKEYRVLRGGDVLLIAERKIKEEDGLTRVSAAAHTAIEDNFLNDWEQGEKSIKAYIGKHQIIDFMNEIDVLYGSLDLYIRTDVNGKTVVGMFEHCPQHGVTYVTNTRHRQLAVGYLTKVLEHNQLI